MKGGSRRLTIGKHGSPWTCEEARGKAMELLRGLAAGVDPLEAKAEAKQVTTVAELVELDLTEGPGEKPNKKASSWQNDRSNLHRHVVPLLGLKSIKSLTVSDVAKFQSDVAAGKAEATAVVDEVVRTFPDTYRRLAAAMAELLKQFADATHVARDAGVPGPNARLRTRPAGVGPDEEITSFV